MKKIFFYTLLTFSLLGTAFFIFSYRFWPFSTGTNAPAFLGTTFGMSFQESQRSLKKNGIQLLDRNKFTELDPSIEKRFPHDWLEGSIFPEDKISNQNITLYMPSINMFDSEVAAEFQFTKNKLTNVEVRIFPLSEKSASSIIEKITNELKQKYTFIKKEYGNEWEIVGEKPNNTPSVYNLEFHSKTSCVFFWVNLADMKNPILKISLSAKNDEKCTSQYLINIQKREGAAF